MRRVFPCTHVSVCDTENGVPHQEQHVKVPLVDTIVFSCLILSHG
jgi:hypothetical protein